MAEVDRPDVYTAYAGHVGTDFLEIKELFDQAGRYQSHETELITRGMERASERVGSVFVLRQLGEKGIRDFAKDPIRGTIRILGDDPLTCQIGGLFIDKDHRGDNLSLPLMAAAEREAYERGMDKAEIFNSADESKKFVKSRLSRFFARVHGYEFSFGAANFMEKPLLDAAGNCIHPSNDLEVPAHMAAKAIRTIQAQADTLGKSQPSPALHPDTIHEFNKAIKAPEDRRLHGHGISDDTTRPLATRWHQYGRFNRRSHESAEDDQLFCRWVNMSRSRYDILHWQDYIGSKDDLRFSRYPDAITSGYYIVRSHNPLIDNAPLLIYFDYNDNDASIRVCDQSETNDAMRALVDSAYVFSNDPHGIIETNDSVYRIRNRRRSSW